MEPPTKRAKRGPAPHDPFGPDEDDDDEIAMDPDEFALKQDPGYRFERSRAVADNKLKSAFERLFEKYGKDFGDTGDEINFYTDEIEVDRGHIASLPAADASVLEGEEEDNDDDERILHGSSGSGSQALVPRNTASWALQGPAAVAAARPRLTNLMPSGVGLTAQPFAFGGAFGGPMGMFGASGPPGFVNGPVDPAWAVPDLPESAFALPQSSALSLPYRGIASMPQRPTAVRKTLPAPVRAEPDSEDDDLILGIAETKSAPAAAKPPAGREETSPRKTAEETCPKDVDKVLGRPRRTRKTAAHGGVDGSTAKAALKGDNAAAIVRKRKRRSSMNVVEEAHLAEDAPSRKTVLVIEIIEKRPPETESAPVLEIPDSSAEHSLPTPPGESNPLETEKEADVPVVAEAAEATEAVEAAASPSKTSKPAETFRRNTLDPAFEFSDEEDFGLKRRPPRNAKKAPVEDDAPTIPSNHSTAPVEVVVPADPPEELLEADETPQKDDEPESESQAPEEEAVPPAKQTPTEDVPAAESEKSPAPPPPPLPLPLPRTPAPSTPRHLHNKFADPPATKSSIVSLVSDDSEEEDELSLGPDDFVFTPQGNMRRVQTGESTRRHKRAVVKALTTVKRKRLSRTSLGRAAVYSSPLANRHRPVNAAVSPGGGTPVKTPGGTLRRCGQDGFRCDRDFCFRCL